MRITNTTIARNYTRNLNANLGRLNDSHNRAVTGRKFSSMAEDTAAGVRAMNVRRSLTQIKGYLDNAQNAKNTIASAEKQMLQISDLTKDIADKFRVGITGTSGADERDILATELEKLRDEILTCANGQYADRYLFGGTNTETPPFTIERDADGKAVLDANGNPILYYNGVKVEDIVKNDPAYSHLFDDAAFVDIGLGMTMKPNPNSQDVVENSAYKNTIVGLDFLGHGKDNLFNVVNEMIASLRGDADKEAEGALLDKFISVSNDVGLQITKMGADSQYLDFTIDRLISDSDQLIERQQQLEFMDPAEAIMDWQMQQYIYNAALQMGQRLLQPTLFNFIS